MIDLHKLDKFRLKDREREFYGCTGDSGNGRYGDSAPTDDLCLREENDERNK